MDDLSRKLRGLDWKTVTKTAKKMQASTASALKDLVMTDLENKTRAVTADTPWGASTTDLTAIAQGTYRREDYALIMSIVWQRLASSRWRCVYKALELLKYLLMHGCARCSEETRAALPHIEMLRTYVAVEGARDVGERVRNRATLICDMLADENVLQEEREKSEELRRKMVGGGPHPSAFSSMSSYDRTHHSHPASVTATASFKGYYDDDAPSMRGYADGGNPTETPHTNTGTTTTRNTVDDLLGDQQASQEPYLPTSTSTSTTIRNRDDDDDDDDDDDFDPRGTAAPMHASAASTEGELFGALSLTEDASTASHASAAETTSQRIARLAADKIGVDGAGALVPASTDAASQMMGNTASVSTTFPMSTMHMSATGMTLAAAGDDGRGQKVLRKVVGQKREEDDAFGDLLTTAQKTIL